MCWVVSSKEHAKKMVLDDSRFLGKIKEKDVYGHEKLLKKKMKSATNLDIDRILR